MPNNQSELLQSAKQQSTLNTDLFKKFTAGVAGLALAMGAAGEASADVPTHPTQPVAVWSTLRPDNPRFYGYEKHCRPHHDLKVRLYERQDIRDDTQRFKVTVETCKRTGRQVLKNLHVRASVTDDLPKQWRIKSLAPGRKKSYFFDEQMPDRPLSQPESNLKDIHINLKAEARNKKSLGANAWTLHGNGQAMPAGPGPDPEAVAEAQKHCTPDPDFQIGFQDDQQTVFQQDIDRGTAFDMANQIFGSNLVRINVIYGYLKKFGMQPYIDAVDSARAHGYDVALTLMPTPIYLAGYDQTLNYQNLDPTEMETFANSVASTFAGEVKMWSPGNELNHPFFNASLSLDKAKAMYLAARTGILAADPSAKIIAGELAPGANVPDWIEMYNTVPNDGISIHPYSDAINHIQDYENLAKTPLYLSEYGNAPGPNQKTNNDNALILARCSGVKELLYYQLIDKTNVSGWNTGVVPAPPRS
jgi:hypothetical protein